VGIYPGITVKVVDAVDVGRVEERPGVVAGLEDVVSVDPGVGV
jgi:hypothetical protein